MKLDTFVRGTAKKKKEKLFITPTDPDLSPNKQTVTRHKNVTAGRARSHTHTLLLLL